MPQTMSWLAAAELGTVWQRVHARLQSNGGCARGRVTVTPLTREQRHALSGLLGKPVLGERVTVDLAALEQRVVERTSYSSLAEATQALTGRPLRDLPRERREREARRHGPLELARELVDAPWAEVWVAGLAAAGVLTRAGDGQELVRRAAAVLEAVLSAPVVPRSRVEVAAQVVGDAHALDEDTVLHAVVLRGLAAAATVPVPSGVLERRALWARHGVSPDSVSATCLVLGLRPSGPGALASRMAAAAAAGDPVHLTAWDLRRRDGAAVSGNPPTLVCENPRVLEAVAERFGGAVPVVCTAGQPNTVVTAVLGWLREAGTPLRHHGDFDWPGVAIVNRLVGQYDVQPWLMGSSEYEAGFRPGSPGLAGTPVEPHWDAELGGSMRTHGVAVHEETVLDEILAALERDW
jgi:uncharacterized protein (TIGR02679 family)